MELRHGDRWSGLVLVGLALYIVFEAARLRFGSVSMPGPGFFPLLLSIALVVLAVCVVGSSVAIFGLPKTIRFENGTSHAMFTFGAICAVAVVIEQLGFMICATALMIVLLRWISRLSWRVSVLTAMGSVSVVYAIFTRLGVPFPRGPLPF
jgi:putative tricarboxylic transport membrane protein